MSVTFQTVADQAGGYLAALRRRADAVIGIEAVLLERLDHEHVCPHAAVILHEDTDSEDGRMYAWMDACAALNAPIEVSSRQAEFTR